MESLIRNELYNYLNANGLLTKTQHGCRPGLSTVTQLLETVTDFAKSLNNGQNIDCIYAYLDYSKAFDTILHRNLIIKMHGYGISPLTMKWIVDFLNNRIQRVKVDGQFSEWAICSSGVSQGSVLRPLLYLININDLPEVIKQATVKINADDTKLYYSWRENVYSYTVYISLYE